MGFGLHRITNDVLDLSKIKVGKIKIKCVQFDIWNEVDIVLSMFDEKVFQKQLKVARLIHDLVPPSLMGDLGRIFIYELDLLKDFILCLNIVFKVVDSLKVGGMHHMKRNQPMMFV